MSALDWENSEKAVQLLCELDAAERSSDCWSGRGWNEVARSFCDRAGEIEDELDDLRREAVDAIADATGFLRLSDEWLDAWQEADADAIPVKQAADFARREHWGDGILEQAA